MAQTPQTISRCMDLATPRNAYLTAFYKRSFAHHTVKNRMPVIVTQIIDNLVRDKDAIREEFGAEGTEDLKLVIGELSKLKYEIQTNKQIRLIDSNASDAEIYNKYITGLSEKYGEVSYFHTIWLLSECYMYRRIREAFEKTLKLQQFDPFQKQKREAYQHAVPLMNKLGAFLLNVLNQSEPSQENFVIFLKGNLWGNKCDLSLTNGVVSSQTQQLFDLSTLDAQILCDHSKQVWKAVSTFDCPSNIIDIIFDNSGYEVFTDLCLADYMTTNNCARTIRFYVKTIPWFISDVMTHDFHWVLTQLKNSEDEVLQMLGARWQNYLDEKTWIIIENDFWTLPMDYSEMTKYNPELYQQLSEAKIAIFKGDLNYRKLFGEKNWDHSLSVEEGLQGFHPTQICTLRTIKSDIVCGLQKGQAEEVEAKDPKWMETGDYGLIQYCGKVVPL